MVFWFLFIFAIYAPYFYFLVSASFAFSNKDATNIPISSSDKKPISIIIPFRNEHGTVQRLIEQLLVQLPDSPNSEVILVDDHSTDDGLSEIKEITSGNSKQFTVLQSTEQGKKSALALGIDKAKNQWIITLDADVLLPNNWLQNISSICSNTLTDLVILPVELQPTNAFFQRLEALEFMVLQCITFGYASQNKAFLANGAHLAFKKSAYLDMGGYTSHENISSGDDVFLLEQIQASPKHSVGFSYHPEIIVTSDSSNTFNELIHQKVRWGGKTMKFKSSYVKWFGVFILLANVGLFALVISGKPFLAFFAFMLKTMIDTNLLYSILTSNRQKKLRKSIPSFTLVYPFYIIFVSVATLLIKPKWKGRNI